MDKLVLLVPLPLSYEQNPPKKKENIDKDVKERILDGCGWKVAPANMCRNELYVVFLVSTENQ